MKEELRSTKPRADKVEKGSLRYVKGCTDNLEKGLRKHETETFTAYKKISLETKGV